MQQALGFVFIYRGRCMIFSGINIIYVGIIGLNVSTFIKKYSKHLPSFVPTATCIHILCDGNFEIPECIRSLIIQIHYAQAKITLNKYTFNYIKVIIIWISGPLLSIQTASATVVDTNFIVPITPLTYLRNNFNE